MPKSAFKRFVIFMPDHPNRAEKAHDLVPPNSFNYSICPSNLPDEPPLMAGTYIYLLTDWSPLPKWLQDYSHEIFD